MASTGSNYFQDYLKDYEILIANKSLVSKLLKAPQISKKKPLKLRKLIDAAQVDEDQVKSFRSSLCDSKIGAIGRMAVSVEPKLMMRASNHARSEQQNPRKFGNSIIFLNNE